MHALVSPAGSVDTQYVCKRALTHLLVMLQTHQQPSPSVRTAGTAQGCEGTAEVPSELRRGDSCLLVNYTALQLLLLLNDWLVTTEF